MRGFLRNWVKTTLEAAAAQQTRHGVRAILPVQPASLLLLFHLIVRPAQAQAPSRPVLLWCWGTTCSSLIRFSPRGFLEELQLRYFTSNSNSSSTGLCWSRAILNNNALSPNEEEKCVCNLLWNNKS